MGCAHACRGHWRNIIGGEAKYIFGRGSISIIHQADAQCIGVYIFAYASDVSNT